MPAAIEVTAASDCCEAPADSSAPVAICSIDLRSCCAAEADWLMPDAISAVAAATRSAIFCCRAKVRARLR